MRGRSARGTPVRGRASATQHGNKQRIGGRDGERPAAPGAAQLLLAARMDGGQRVGEQVLCLVEAGMEGGRRDGRKMLLLLPTGMENIVVVLN